MNDEEHARWADRMLDEELQKSDETSPFVIPDDDLGPENNDPLTVFDSDTQCYFLNQKVRENGRKFTDDALARLGRHAPTIAALAPADRNDALDIILDQSTSLEQGKGPTAILKEANSELHGHWLYAQSNPVELKKSASTVVAEPINDSTPSIPRSMGLQDRAYRGLKSVASRTIGVYDTLTNRSKGSNKVPRDADMIRYSKRRNPVRTIQLGIQGLGIAAVTAGAIIAGAHLTRDTPQPYDSAETTTITLPADSRETVPSTLESILERTTPEFPILNKSTEKFVVQQNYAFEPSIPTEDVSSQELPLDEWTSWKPEYSGLELTQDVTFALGQQLYKTFLDAGVPEEVAIPSVKATAIDNEWYDPDKVVDGELREGENPLVLDSYPRAGETYTLTLDATEFVPEPIESVSELADSFDVSSFEPGLGPYMGSYTPENGTGVLGALREVIGDEELYAQASRFSVVATGIHPKNNLFPEECLTASGSFDYDACPRPVNKIKPWTAGREYTLVVTFPEDFSKENDYGGNFDYKVK